MKNVSNFEKTKEFILKNCDLQDSYFSNRNFSMKSFWDNKEPELQDYVFELYEKYNSFYETPFSNFIKYYFFGEGEQCYCDIDDFLKKYHAPQRIHKNTKKFIKYYPQQRKFIKFDTENFAEIFYCYRNGLNDRPTCSNENCSEKCEFVTTKYGFRKYCSQKCQLHDNNIEKVPQRSDKSNLEIRTHINKIPLDRRNLTNREIQKYYLNIEDYSKWLFNQPTNERIYIFMNKLNESDITCVCGDKKSFYSQGVGYKLSCGKNSCIHQAWRGDSYYKEDVLNAYRNKNGQTTETGFLYVLESKELTAHKIGIAVNPIKRFNKLLKSVPDLKMKICIFIERGLYKKEKYLHKLYKNKNVIFESSFDGYTEYFHLTPEDIESIREYLYEN